MDHTLLLPGLPCVILASALLGNAAVVLLQGQEESAGQLFFRMWQTRSSVAAGCGAVLGGGMFLAYKRQSLLAWADAAAPGAALGIAVLRVGCLSAGCCYGRPCYLPWAITFDAPFHPLRGMPLHPTQIYYLLAALLTLSLLLWAKNRLPRPGQLAGMFLCCFGMYRLVIDLFRADHSPVVLGLSPTQIVMVGLMGIGLWLMLRWKMSQRGR